VRQLQAGDGGTVLPRCLKSITVYNKVKISALEKREIKTSLLSINDVQMNRMENIGCNIINSKEISQLFDLKGNAHSIGFRSVLPGLFNKNTPGI
jgi:hypothetical protein